MTKTKSLFIICLALLIAIFSGCRNNDNYSETKTKGNTDVVTTAESTTKENTVSETTTEKESSSETTTKTAEQKSAVQTTTKKVTTTQNQTTTERQTSAKKQTVTNKPTTTKKQSTTKEKTTVSTTSKRNKLTKNDVEWVQSQAHSYIKSKGMSVNSNVSSFSYRTSSYNYTDKNKLLSAIKETIDFEYNECIDSGWKKVDMYVSISSDGDGDYWLVVMYG